MSNAYDDGKSSKREAEESASQEKDGPSQPKKAKLKEDNKLQDYECKLCDSKFFTLGQYTCHIQSFEHRKRTILQTADKVFSKAPQYRGGRESDLPPGLSGRKVVHCKVCNVYTNSAKQLAEHLSGGRHKQVCFKFNVPITTLELTSDDTKTLEGTRLQGDKLMCKCCSVQLTSMEQYKAHMATNKHKLVMERKPVRPQRKIKKALKPFYKNTSAEEKQEKSDDKTKNYKDDEKDKQKDESKDKKKDTSKDGKKEKKDKGEDKVPDSKGADRTASAKVRDKYQLNLLDELNEQPTLRNELDFFRSHRPKKDKKTRPQPIPYLCDICHVFSKSAFELNEHLASDRHKETLCKFLKGEKSPPDKDSKNDDKPAEVTDSTDKQPQNPELYCDICQLLLPSLGTKREHEKSKQHKFLEALRKNVKTEPRAEEAATGKKPEATKTVTAARTAKTLHCSVCRMDLESNEAMEEHVQSKKHKFLSALKPVPPAPARRLEESTRHKRAGPYDSSSDRREWRRGKRRNEEDEEEMPELAAVALERRALQAQLAQRRQEIEEQRRLIAELREEQHLEAEKAALRRMIDECRQLIEEREKNKRRAVEVQESISRKAAKSVQWHPSVTEVKKQPEDPRRPKSYDYEEPQERLSLVKKAHEEWEREQLEKARNRGHAQPAFVTVNREKDDWEKDSPSVESSISSFMSFSHWDGKIPLLDGPVETHDDTDASWSSSLPVLSQEGTPTFRGPIAGDDTIIEPFSRGQFFGQVDADAVFSQESIGKAGIKWRGAVHSPPVWSSGSQDSHDWNHPVLCTPSSTVPLLGEEPVLVKDEHSHSGENSNLLRSRQGLLDDRSSHLVEKPSLLGSRPGLLGDRPSFLEERPSVLGENRSLLGSKPGLLEDLPSPYDGRCSLLGSRPSHSEDRPHLLEDRPSSYNGRPSHLGSRTSQLEDRSHLLENRTSSYDGRPSPLGSRPGLLEDRPGLLEDRSSFYDGKPSLLGSRPIHMEDRSHLLEGSPSLYDGKAGLLGSRPIHMEDRPSTYDGKPGLLGSRPSQLENRPSPYAGRPSPLASRPSLLEDRPRLLEDGPSLYDGNTSLLGSRPSRLEDRPSLRDGSPNFARSRRSLLCDTPGLLEDRSSLLEERPEQRLQFWGQSSRQPTSEPDLWAGSSSLRIPGLDLV
ncbi:uncharacterized protein LOC119173674 isoform X3 [Rhipicephalus microplus]|uniref:uncharacterized protein LOC119173674 isoform X3 n=1 Tax=Rhipicephalus microplus TaxID=6941 RepID=UPI003F6D81BA